MSGSFPYLRWRWQLESKSFLPQRDNLWFPQRWKCLIFKPLQDKVYFFCKPCAPCASLWWQWVTNNGNNAHLYTGVYCETALWGMQPGGSPQIDLEPLPACGADQSPRKAFVENQPAQAQRKTLFRFERLDTQSEIGGLWEPISPLYWLAWESLTMCHTQQNKDNYTWLNPSTLTEIHTLVSVNSFIGCTHFTHNCMRAVISINKHVVMQNTSYKLANVH